MEKQQLNLFKLRPLFMLGLFHGGSFPWNANCCLLLSKPGQISALDCMSLTLLEEKRGWKFVLLILLWILAIGIMLMLQAFRDSL